MKIISVTTVPITFAAFTKGQFKFFASKGFSVWAVSSPGNLLDDMKTRDSIETHAIPMTRGISPFKDIVALCRMIRFLHREKPQIVNGSTPKAALISLLSAFILRIPVRIYFVRGLRFESMSGVKRTIVKNMEKFTCFCANQILCNSQSARNIIVKEGFCRPKKVKILHNGSSNGCDSTRFNPDINPKIVSDFLIKNRIPEDSLKVLFVGRIVRDKGVLDLHAAWNILKARYSNIQLLIAGTPEFQDPIPVDILDDLQQDETVTMLGHVTDMPPLYAIADFLVLPTYREGFPNVPMEASSMELPVVATKVTGCVDAVVDGVTGTLVPPRDPETLAQAIAMYLDDPELRRKHGKAGRERVVRDFKPEDIWQALYEEYVRLLKEKGLPVPQPKDHP